MKHYNEDNIDELKQVLSKCSNGIKGYVTNYMDAYDYIAIPFRYDKIKEELIIIYIDPNDDKANIIAYNIFSNGNGTATPWMSKIHRDDFLQWCEDNKQSQELFGAMYNYVYERQ